MKTTDYFRSVLILAVVAVFCGLAAAQDKVSDAPPQETQRRAGNNPGDIRTAALRQLKLSPDQAQRIRRLNVERKPLMDAAQIRLRETNRVLDEMIYADTVTDSDVQVRLKDFQLAQAEVAKIRFMNELAVRRILTPEQLVRFRRMRERFDQVRNNGGGRLPAGRQAPNNAAKPAGTPSQVQQLVKQDQKKPTI